MVKFIDLPEEVIEEIANGVDAYNIMAFLGTCTKMRRIAFHRRDAHKAKEYEFATLVAGSFASSDWYWLEEVHPSVHLQHLVEGDRGCYASTMYIGAIGEQAEWDDDLDEDHVVQAKNTMFENIPPLYGSRITKMVSEISHSLCPNVDGEAQTWSDYVKGGDRGATVLLLLARCPNLVSLKMFHAKEEWSPLFTKVFSSMIANPCENRLFTRLSNFELRGYGDPYNPGFADAKILPAFMAMPTVKEIKCSAIEGRNCPWRYGSAISSVTRIDIEHSDLDAACLWNYLGGVKALQDFRYTFHTSCSFGQLGWMPRNTILALRRYARESLLSLELTMEPVDYDLDWPRHQKFKNAEPFVASLSSFNSLHTIRLDAMMLFTPLITPEIFTGEDFSHLESEVLMGVCRASTNQRQPSFEDNFWENHSEGLRIRRLVDLLPASVEKLEIIGRLFEGDVIEMFSGLLKLKRQRVPHLQRIHLTGNGQLSPSTREICPKVGITLSCD